MKLRPDLTDDRSPAGLEVVQITCEAVPAAHVYMEAQVFTPDSRRFLLHAPATAHSGFPPPGFDDVPHRWYRCDVDDGFALTPIIDEPGAVSPSVTPDGSAVVYLLDHTRPDGGRLEVRRVGIDGTGRETILVVDTPLPGTRDRISRPYPLTTISSDGRRLATSVFLGDGATPGADYGLVIFDLVEATARLVLRGPEWCNMHPQYCRSADPAASGDVLVQQNHGCACDESGAIARLTGGAGADIHVIADDGTGFRSLPWGRNGEEFCQGHQCWRGRSTTAITSTAIRPSGLAELIESPPADHAGHLGINTPGGRRNILSRSFERPGFCHFATDAAGRRLVSDCWNADRSGWSLYVADLPQAQGAPAGGWTYLLDCRTTAAKQTHVHPFLSPDGSTAFFNSDESGLLQAYAIRGW